MTILPGLPGIESLATCDTLGRTFYPAPWTAVFGTDVSQGTEDFLATIATHYCSRIPWTEGLSPHESSGSQFFYPGTRHRQVASGSPVVHPGTQHRPAASGSPFVYPGTQHRPAASGSPFVYPGTLVTVIASSGSLVVYPHLQTVSDYGGL